ncbi:hypothetical protein HY408_00610 [Candidatus Gottesmanbacteria bacterium]|nr:hypothetical protein [Candidatus Gottesmanbacteria bacterium]
MGAEGFLVASTVNLVIAQRLVRKICSTCIEAYEPGPELISHLKKIFGEQEVSKKFYHGKGCIECGNRGYKGRIGIFEVLEVNDEIRSLVLKQVPAAEIMQVGLRNGMIPLIRDGLNKASGGITTIEEVLRVVRE